MKGPAAAALALVLLLPVPGGNAGTSAFPPAPMRGERGAGDLLDLGMPRAAMDAFRALPPAARAASPVLPRLMRQLADAGRPDDAVALAGELQALLREPLRSEVFLALGTIHRERKELAKAEAAYRQVGKATVAAPEAAYQLARIAAGRGDAAAAAKILDAAPAGGRKSLLAGQVEMLRRNPAGAAAAWDNAPADDPAGKAARRLLRAWGAPQSADDPVAAAAHAERATYPERAADLEAAARRRLVAGHREAALAAATDGLAIAGAWERAAATPAAWDGSRAGADNAWRAAAALFPYGEDAGRFLSSGRAFLGRAVLAGTVREAEGLDRDVAARVAAARKALAARRAEIAARIERLGAIGKEYRERARKAGDERRMLRAAAASVATDALGEARDPGIAALLRTVGRRDAEIAARLDRMLAEAQGWVREDAARTRSPDEMRVLFFAKDRVERADLARVAIQGRAALARARAWNRWKADYAARLTAILGKIDGAVAEADRGARRSAELAPGFFADLAEIDAWDRQLARSARRLAEDAAALSRLSSGAGAVAARSLAEARGETIAAIGRKTRTLHYLAARAATEWRIEERGRPSDNGALAPARRKELAALAIRHWEGALPPRGGDGPAVDESLYALAELRFEEEQSRFLDNEAAGAPPGFAGPVALFRRVLDEFPASPYAEPASYGLALCYQESGASEQSVAVLERLLAQHPQTRYAPEINLRLGEYAFDEYEFRRAEDSYRKIGESAPPEIRTTALYKLGWSLFLQNRPREAIEPFLTAVLLSPAARRTGGLREESLRMAARSIVEANAGGETEALLARRGAGEHGAALLLRIQEIEDTQNRYEDAVRIADRIAASYPLAPERVDAEIAAAKALSKAKRDDESNTRRGRFAAVFGPGSAWQAAEGRRKEEIRRADAVAEEELRNAAFHFHRASRERSPGHRAAALSLYDAHMAGFPSSPKAEEIAYQRAWLLFEDGKKKEAGASFEAVGRRPGGARREASLYMAVQCAKELAAPSDPPANAEVARLCLEYERALPSGERLASVLLDRARAQFNAKDFPGAAAAGAAAAAHPATAPLDRRAALRLVGEARFRTEDYAGAEDAFRKEIAAGTDAAADNAALAKWIGFSMFRRAEKLPKERAADAGELFARAAREFPALEIAPLAAFRAGISFSDAGRIPDAIASLLPVEAGAPGASLAADATRVLARLYEKDGKPVPAAERVERLAAAADNTAERLALTLKAADLFVKGKDAPRARKNLLAAAALPDTPSKTRIWCLFRSAESLAAEGNETESDALYAELGNVHRAAPDAAPDLAGQAFFRRAEARFRTFAPMTIAEPIEQTFVAKQAALDACVPLYVEAVGAGDRETVSAALHRLGEGFENFRSAILASPVPAGFSKEEREEYAFLLEEKAAPLEEKAVEAYQKNLRQAVASGATSSWVAMSVARLKAMRPARFARKWDYAFPVLPVPDFRGIVERGIP